MKIDEATRKAARVGEFQELAWLLKFELVPSLTQLQRGNLLADLISFIESNCLGIAGHLGSFTVVSLANRQAVSVKEQSLVLSWLIERPEIHGVNNVGLADNLSDAWFEVLLVSEDDTRSPSFNAFFNV